MAHGHRVIDTTPRTQSQLHPQLVRHTVAQLQTQHTHCHNPVMVSKAHTLGHKRCNHRHNHTVTTMHTHTQTQTTKYRVLDKEQLSHTHRATQMPGSHADPIAYITRHNHQHKTQTHAQDSSESPAPAHMRAHTATVTQTPGHTLSHLPIACFPLPPRYHTQSRRHPQTLQTDRAALGPWGAAPHPQPESWSLGAIPRRGRQRIVCGWGHSQAAGQPQGPLTKPLGVA